MVPQGKTTCTNVEVNHLCILRSSKKGVTMGTGISMMMMMMMMIFLMHSSCLFRFLVFFCSFRSLSVVLRVVRASGVFAIDPAYIF